jgi:signal transduction histidine kinase
MANKRRVVCSVRFKVTAIAAVCVLAVLIIAVVTVALLQRKLMTENLRDAITQRADDLSDLLAGGADALVPTGGEDTVVQVVDDTTVLMASPALAGVTPLGPPAGVGSNDEWRTIDPFRPGDDPQLMLTRQVVTPLGPVTLHVASTLGDIHEATTVLVRVVAFLVPLLVILLAAVTWWLVGRTLSPVEALRAEVAGIGGSELQRRVPVPDGYDEITRLATTMNGMLDRVETARRAQDRFVADASHELRTPLTRMRGELDVALANPVPADPTLSYHSLLDETIRMQRLVEDLLYVAQSDAARSTIRYQPVDLDDLVFAEAQRLRGLDCRTIDISAVSAVQVNAVPMRLSRAIANVAENAVRYAASTVVFAAGERDGWAELSITDDGPGVPADKREVIFERFGRADPARSVRSGNGGTSVGGTGLGLAIARDIVESHGGSVYLDATFDQGARFVIRLPAVRS